MYILILSSLKKLLFPDQPLSHESSDINTCPISHPHSFKDGTACCRFPMEAYRYKDPLCRGRSIDYRSNCCYGDKEVRCLYKFVVLDVITKKVLLYP